MCLSGGKGFSSNLSLGRESLFLGLGSNSNLSALADFAGLWIILVRRLHWNIIHLIIWEVTWVCSD